MKIKIDPTLAEHVRYVLAVLPTVSATESVFYAPTGRTAIIVTGDADSGTVIEIAADGSSDEASVGPWQTGWEA
jgi:hypothetical protein